MLILSSIIAWGSGVWASVTPLLPGFMAIGAWTYGGHLAAFGGSWWTARRYAVSCVGEGISGFTSSYWRLSSATCTTLLFSHAALLATAVASLFCTVAIFAWFWYKSFRYMVAPVLTEIRSEFGDKATTNPYKPREIIDLTTKIKTEPKPEQSTSPKQATVHRYFTRSRRRDVAPAYTFYQ